ncbi:hypothetical protein YPPY100_2711, partial [Yersinia pestis PY-100]
MLPQAILWLQRVL